MTKFDQRLVPNYIAALAIIFVFLGGFVYTLINFEDVTSTIIVEGDATGSAARASAATAIVTAMIFITKEVTTYLFRKNPSPEPTPAV